MSQFISCSCFVSGRAPRNINYTRPVPISMLFALKNIIWPTNFDYSSNDNEEVAVNIGG